MMLTDLNKDDLFIFNYDSYFKKCKKCDSPIYKMIIPNPDAVGYTAIKCYFCNFRLRLDYKHRPVTLIRSILI